MTRPAFYTPELAAAICDRLADGRSLRSVASDEDMPSRDTIRRWLRDHEEFARLYAQASDERADALFEDMLAIADDATLDWQDRKVRIATRQWAMAKMKPKKYGDRVELAGDPERPVVAASDPDLARRLAFLLTSAATSAGQRDRQD